MMSATTSSISPPNLLYNILRPKPISCLHTIPIKNPTNSSYQPLTSHLTLSSKTLSYPFHVNHGKPTFLRVSPEDAAVVSSKTSQEIVSAATSSGDDGVYSIISILLFTAFVALSVLTIGVVYIGVTDFLQKREKEKFEKEEEAKMKKKGGKKKAAARSRDGPRGFGQKIDPDFDD